MSRSYDHDFRRFSPLFWRLKNNVMVICSE
jgi:hypothetical protein